MALLNFKSQLAVAFICDMSETLMIYYIPNCKVPCKGILKFSLLQHLISVQTSAVAHYTRQRTKHILRGSLLYLSQKICVSDKSIYIVLEKLEYSW